MSKHNGDTRPDLTHAQSEKRHAIKSCLKRYGLKLSNKDLSCFQAIIEGGLSIYLSDNYDDPTREHNRETHIVRFRGHQMRMVYSQDNKQPVTFLPLVDRR